MALGAHSTSASSRPAASIRHNKRKRENEAPIQRLVARKLQLCADANDAFASAQRSLKRQLQRYKAQKSRADKLSRLHLVIEQTTQFQILFGAEMDGESVERPQVMSLRKRMDKLLTKVSSKKKPVTLRTQKVVRRLPRLLKKATSIVSERRQLIKEQEELPARHQWVPMILWRIYDDLGEVAGKDEELKPLKTAMHEMMKTLRETNPFFYLQVLYQPPPEHLDEQWEVTASEKLTAITASMTPFFRDLKRRSSALRNTRDLYVRIHYGWNQLRVTLAFARRAARHFHFLVLHLYAMAIGCAESNVHAGIISEKAASGILSEDAELRSRLRLCRDAASSEDYLLKESYEWTPELLVYVDEWRRHRDNRRVLFGFDRRERQQDFLPQFLGGEQARRHNSRIPRYDVLAEIGFHLRDVGRVWGATRLGTSDFESMQIEDIGALEKNIKGSLGAVVDLVYKMMLARWMNRKKRSDGWWTSLELRETIHFDPEQECQIDLEDYAEDSHVQATNDFKSDTVEADEDLQDATDAESIEHKEVQRSRVRLPAEGGFRSPTTVTLCEVMVHTLAAKMEGSEVSAPSEHVIPIPVALEQPMRFRDVFAWTEEEIKIFTRGTKRIAKVRAAMLGLCDRLEWSKVSLEATSTTETATRPAFGEYVCDDWRVACIANRLCTLTNKAVAYAEEAAIYEAASSLTKKASLRLTESDTVAVEDNSDISSLLVASDEPTMEELQDSVRNAHECVAELLSLYDGQQSTEWRDTILSTGLATAHLLRTISQDEIVHEVMILLEGGNIPHDFNPKFLGRPRVPHVHSPATLGSTPTNRAFGPKKL